MLIKSGRCCVCGCTERYGCAGGCSWVEPRAIICSRCVRNAAVLLLAWRRLGVAK